jgi:hypothetical protein
MVELPVRKNIARRPPILICIKRFARAGSQNILGRHRCIPLSQSQNTGAADGKVMWAGVPVFRETTMLKPTTAARPGALRRLAEILSRLSFHGRKPSKRDSGRATDHRGFSLFQLLATMFIMGLISGYLGAKHFGKSKQPAQTAPAAFAQRGAITLEELPPFPKVRDLDGK